MRITSKWVIHSVESDSFDIVSPVQVQSDTSFNVLIITWMDADTPVPNGLQFYLFSIQQPSHIQIIQQSRVAWALQAFNLVHL